MTLAKTEEGPLFTGKAVLDAALLTERKERQRWARMLREEADAIEQLTEDWTVEEVAQELRDMADKIERGGVR